jgi:hypothetical protein
MNELLEKYWEGTASLNEENQLRDYFASDQVSPEHEMYTPLFTALQSESEVEMNFDAFAKVNSQELDKKQERRGWKGLAIAAGFALLVAAGASTFQVTQEKDLGTYDNPEEAYAATMDALELISTKFNKGRNNLAPAAHVSDKTTNIFNIQNK